MMQFVAQLKRFSTSIDGGYVVSFDVTDNQLDNVKEVLGLHGKNLTVTIKEI